MQQKTCTKCGVAKPLDHFHKSNRATGKRSARGGLGVQAQCKECTAEAKSPGIAQKKIRYAQLLALGIKTCSECRIDKPHCDFNKRKASSDGVCFRCRECDNLYVAKWREKNPDAFKTWYSENKEKRSDDFRKWLSENKEHRRESYTQWARDNKHIVRAISARKHAAKLKATPSWANQEAIRKIYAEAVRLTQETGVRHEVDHIYPLQGKTVCGLHCETNLRVITKVENIRKHNKMPDL